MGKVSFAEWLAQLGWALGFNLFLAALAIGAAWMFGWFKMPSSSQEKDEEN